MIAYHKIQSLFKRDPDNNYKTFTEEFSLPAFDVLQDLNWFGTEKIDGMNIRVSRAAIGGRSDNAQIPGDLAEVLKEIQASLLFSELPDETMLVGEGYGAGIQKGGSYREDKAFVLFDVLINGRYVEQDVMWDIADTLGLRAAPLLASAPLLDWVAAISEGKFKESKLHPEAPNEGVVLRSPVELIDSFGNRMITKLKFKDFPE